MSYLEELLPEFRKGAKIKCKGWDEDSYIEMNKSVGVIVNNKDRIYTFSYEDFAHSHWELYKEPEPDWDYESMIGCVGWFWDNDDEEKSLGVLTEYAPARKFPFFKGNNDNTYYNFRPAKKSELKFWEDD